MALWGEPGAMIEDGMYILTTDDLTCNNKYKHNTSPKLLTLDNTLYVLSVQAKVRLQWYLRNLY